MSTFRGIIVGSANVNQLYTLDLNLVPKTSIALPGGTNSTGEAVYDPIGKKILVSSNYGGNGVNIFIIDVTTQTIVSSLSNIINPSPTSHITSLVYISQLDEFYFGDYRAGNLYKISVVRGNPDVYSVTLVKSGLTQIQGISYDPIRNRILVATGAYGQALQIINRSNYSINATVGYTFEIDDVTYSSVDDTIYVLQGDSSNSGGSSIYRVNPVTFASTQWYQYTNLVESIDSTIKYNNGKLYISFFGSNNTLGIPAKQKVLVLPVTAPVRTTFNVSDNVADNSLTTYKLPVVINHELISIYPPNGEWNNIRDLQIDVTSGNFYFVDGGLNKIVSLDLNNFTPNIKPTVDNNNNPYSFPVFIRVIDQLTAPNTPNFTLPSTICLSGSANFTDTSTNAVAWKWDFGSGANPQTSNLQNVVGIKYSSAGSKTILLNVTFSDGSVQTIAKVLNVVTPSIPAISLIGKQLVISNPDSLSTYQWYKDGNPILNANGYTYNISKTGTYKVIITNTNGCSATSNSITSVFGCTNPNASNYNAGATLDDGSCTFISNCPQILKNLKCCFAKRSFDLATLRMTGDDCKEEEESLLKLYSYIKLIIDLGCNSTCIDPVVMENILEISSLGCQDCKGNTIIPSDTTDSNFSPLAPVAPITSIVPPTPPDDDLELEDGNLIKI